MKLLLALFAAYLLLINLDAYLLMRSDKRRAQSGGRRIPEATLMLTALLGGSPGILLAMKRYRHKTLHHKFSIGVPLIAIFEAAILLAIIYLAI